MNIVKVMGSYVDLNKVREITDPVPRRGDEWSFSIFFGKEDYLYVSGSKAKDLHRKILAAWMRP